MQEGPSPPIDAMTRTGVIHGRFQPLHKDHMKYLLAGWERCDHLVVAITNPDPGLSKKDSADEARSTPQANPLTYFERYRLIRAALPEAGLEEPNFSIVPLPINFPELYGYYVPLNALFFLTIYDEWGRRKLEMFRSLGLRTDVMWDKPPSEKGITGREVRERMKRGENWEELVPPRAVALLKQWNIPARVRRL